MEYIEQMIWGFVPDEDEDELVAQFGDDQPIELIAHVFAKNPIPKHFGYVKKLFPAKPPKDGRKWNRSRKFGACYEFACRAQQDEADAIRELVGVGKDKAVYLVHGYCRYRGFEHYFGHAWVEVGDYVVDCGSLRKTRIVSKRKEFYLLWDVKHAKRYTPKQANNKLRETHAYNCWEKPPVDLPMVKIV